MKFFDYINSEIPLNVLNVIIHNKSKSHKVQSNNFNIQYRQQFLQIKYFYNLQRRNTESF